MEVKRLMCKRLFMYNRNYVFFDIVISRYVSTGVNLFLDTQLTDSTKKDIERYWKDKVNLAGFNEADNSKEKFYVLPMFPYPSGLLHMGHVRVYTISDAVCRFYRMKGYNVLHPMGWDAFGLPAENAAIEHGINPDEWTKENIKKMKDQLLKLNYTFDWDREFSTCDPIYSKWTQELFLKLYRKGLAYQKEAFVNWDPVDETVLAEEQVDTNNCSWRSGAKVEKKLLNQWFIRTTPFAKSLFDGLDNPILKEWKDIKKMQRNWIGKCNGTSFELQLITNIPNYPKTINVWTDIPEFIEYAKFVAISPNSLLNRPMYCRNVNNEVKIIDGKVLNPFNGEELPVFVTDNVKFPLFRDTYLGIPSASMDDHQFSERVGIEFRRHSIKSPEEQQSKLSEILCKAQKWKIGGYPVSSRLKDWLISRQRYWGTPIPIIHCTNCGAQPVPREQLPVLLPKVQPLNKKFKLCEVNDWLNTSCPKCGGQAIREMDTMDTFVDSSWYFLRFIDPKNTEDMFSIDKAAKMFPVDLYIGGKEHGVLHLYFARFISHFLHSEGLIPSQEPFKQLLVQGMIMGKTYQVKSTGKYLKADQVEEREGQHVEKSSKEPVNIMWEKMSKSKYNGIDPLELLNKYGIDTTRLLILADFAPTSTRNWSDDTIPGIINWQDRMWKTVRSFILCRENITTEEEFRAKPIDPKFVDDDAYMFDSRNYFLKSVTFNMMESQQLSVAISRMQGLTNSLRKVSVECQTKSREFERALAVQIIMLAPLAPHFASELWAGFCAAKYHLISENEVELDKDVTEQDWPEVDMEYNMTLHINVNRKSYKKFKIPRYKLDRLSAAEAFELAENDPEIQKYLKDKHIVSTKFLSKAGCDATMNIFVKGMRTEESVAS